MPRSSHTIYLLPSMPEATSHAQGSAAHPAVIPAETADYGAYIVEMATCRDCHGPNLTGGDGASGGPVGPNISPTGAVVVLQAIFQTVSGQARSMLVTVLSTLLIAAIAAPLRRRLQSAIDRRFYCRR